MSPTTQIWGDGNCTNGFAFGTTCNSPAQDRLRGGQSIVLENRVNIENGANNGIKFDGGDKILSTYPIAITRGAYPTTPGSLMAGGVEVLDTTEWGTFFIAPVGQNVVTNTSAFEHTALYVMAMEDNTTINFSDGARFMLGCGESHTYIVRLLGTTLTASAPVQVDLIVGDIGSTYELRWYSLLPHEAWTNSYMSPVGDSRGETKIFLYNPRSSELRVNIQHAAGFRSSYNRNLPPGGWRVTDVIPSGTGALLTAPGEFIALSLTDTAGTNNAAGQTYDWGFPVLPTNKMTETVLVGWGYGCTDKNCAQPNDVGGRARSVVWVSPWEDADIYIDIDNDGIPEANRTVRGARRLSSSIFENGADLSGATIWAVKPGAPFDSMESVRIAAAWGQNPAFSLNHQPLSLDLGKTSMISSPCLSSLDHDSWNCIPFLDTTQALWFLPSSVCV